VKLTSQCFYQKLCFLNIEKEREREREIEEGRVEEMEGE
jgi:hypothetical protein